MKKLLSSLLSVTFLFGIIGGAFGQGNNNPTGPSGDFNGRINTAGSYDPYTGNAKRVINDLSVVGGVGAYPLRWTRFFNSRHTLSTASVVLGQGAYWTHSYTWTIDLSMNIGYPDGRFVPFGDGEAQAAGDVLWGPAGTPDRLLVVTAPVGTSLGEYDLLLSDGGKVCFRREPYYTNSGGPFYTTRATKIVDPYNLEIDISYTTTGALDRITEPAGRYLQVNYSTVPGTNSKVIGSVWACDGRGNVTQTVNYTYVYSLNFTKMTRADYNDGTYATYTYQSDRLLSTCNDVRYAGPMAKIRYEYMNNGTFGQLKSERNFTTQQIVSQIAYPSNTVRVETRGDGPTRTLNYDPQGRLVSYTDFCSAGFPAHTSYISYDVNGFRSAFQDARGKITYTQREGNIGALIRLTHPDQNFRGYGYTDYDNPSYVNIVGNERGRNTYFTRDGNHRIEKIWYPDWDPNNPNNSPAESVTYNGFGQVLSHTMTSGGTKTWTYDTRGLLQTYAPAPTESDPNPGAHPYRYFYDGADRLWYTTDPYGNATWFSYNGRNQITRITHQDGSYVQADYNSDGTTAWMADENHPNAATDPNQRTRFFYDEYKRLTSVTNPMNETTTINYALDWTNSLVHTTGNMKYINTPSGRSMIFDYDPNFRERDHVVALNTADEAWTLFEYDDVGNLTKVTDPRWNATTFTYDDRNRRDSRTNPVPFNNQVTRWEYDPVGNVTKEIRPGGSFRRWEYDSMNRLSDSYGYANEHIHFGRDKAGNITELIDQKSVSYSFSFDAMNRKKGASYPTDATNAQRSEAWHYDFASRVDQYTNPAGQVRNFNYDSRNRPWDSWWSNGEGPLTSTRFDVAGRLSSVTTNNGETSITFGYDDANRKISEEETVQGHTYRLETSWNADGLPKDVVAPWVGGVDVHYSYNQRNQLAGITDWAGNLWFKYDYDASGNMIKRQNLWASIDDATRAEYDALNRPTVWENTQAGDAFVGRSHQRYDDLGRLTATWRDESGKGDTFGYDPAGQLTSAWYDADQVWTGNPVNPAQTESFNVNALNRVSVNANGTQTGYASNDMNQYTNVGGTTVGYDNKFNLNYYGGATATYNAQNQLTSVSSGNNVQFLYDGLGRCVRRTVNNAPPTYIQYHGWKPIMEYDAWGNNVAWNVFGPGPDEILYRWTPAGGETYYHTDERGNVRFILDGGGNGAEEYFYTAFGQPTIYDWSGHVRSDSLFGNRFMFQGRERISEVNIYDFRNRFYFPLIGRFLQGDPIGFAGGDANLFRYCGHDPVNGRDPSGLLDWATTERITVVGTYPGGIGDSAFNINQGAFTTNSAGPDERSYPPTFGDGQRVVPSIVPYALPDEEEEPAQEEDHTIPEEPTNFVEQSTGASGTGSGSGPAKGNGFAQSATNAAGAVTGAIDQAYGGSGYWLGRNGLFNSNTWGGNGATGARSTAMMYGRVARMAGKVFFGYSIYLSGQSMYQNPTAGNIAHQSVNMLMGLVGFAGPEGFAISLAYTLVDETVGWNNAALSLFPLPY